jgi:AmmeMemoRadiSam system protein A
MYMTEKMPGVRYNLVDYKNSGDAAGIGGKSRVVGYYAISAGHLASQSANTADQPDEMISDKDRQVLLNMARDAIVSRLSGKQQGTLGDDKLSPALLQRAGVFVSLYKQGKLRGCIGRFSTDNPLYLLVKEIAVSSALHDHRFSPLRTEEIPSIKIEISVLTPLKKIKSIDEFELGRHGIYIKKVHRFRRRPEKDQTTVMHERDLGEHAGVLQKMRCHDRDPSVLRKLLEKDHQFFIESGSEARSRFIQQDNRRIAVQCPGEADALRLPG